MKCRSIRSKMKIACSIVCINLLSGAIQANTISNDYQRTVSKKQMIWIDGSVPENLKQMSSRKGIHEVILKCKSAKIDTILLDVKPITGYVLYNSQIAPKLKQWRGVTIPEKEDILKITLDEAHQAGIEVYAAINAFSEGHRIFKKGLAYQKKNWQMVSYEPHRIVVNSKGKYFPLKAYPNESPTSKAITLWTNRIRLRNPNEFDVVLQNNRVINRIDGRSSGPDVLVAPKDGLILSGFGEGRKWLIRHAVDHEVLAVQVKPCFRLSSDSNQSAWAILINPINPEARSYERSIVQEILSKYPVDGIVFDRLRYDGLTTDFSPLSRKAFEAWLRKSVKNWPNDIYSYDIAYNHPIIRGPLYKQWQEWRAQNIRDYLIEINQIRQKVRPQAKIGVYVGSWREYYEEMGVNWGSNRFKDQQDWMSDTYASTGISNLVDFIIAGAFHRYPTGKDALAAGIDSSESVEGAIERTQVMVKHERPVYGGLYLLQYNGNPEWFRQALSTSLSASHGVMLFDLCYLNEYNWWPILEGCNN